MERLRAWRTGHSMPVDGVEPQRSKHTALGTTCVTVDVGRRPSYYWGRGFLGPRLLWPRLLGPRPLGKVRLLGPWHR